MSALMGFAGSPNHYGEHPFILGPIFADQYNGWPVRVISLAQASLSLSLSIVSVSLFPLWGWVREGRGMAVACSLCSSV